MIAKRIDKKAEVTSSFTRLAHYVVAAKDKGEKLDEAWVVGFDNQKGDSVNDTDKTVSLEVERSTKETLDDLDLYIKEAEAVQAMHTTAKDKTYHLLISFRDEHPTLEQLKEIEKAFCEGLGFGEHQRIVATHKNTDNFHMHVAINKVHPTTFRCHSPSWDFRKLPRIARELERKYGLKVDLGPDDKKQQPFPDYASERSHDLLKDVELSTTWAEAHAALAKQGLAVKLRGNGLALTDLAGRDSMKASDLHRSLSKAALEKRFGDWQEPDRAALPKPEHTYRPPVATVARDFEAKTWRQAFATYLTERKEPLLDALDQSKDWKDVHVALAHYGLRLKPYGQGCVITDEQGKVHVKASTLGPEWGKAALEQRFGTLEAAEEKALPKAMERYHAPPLTRHRATREVWGRRSLLWNKDLARSWRRSIEMDAGTDPLAREIINYHRRFLRALSPSPKREKPAPAYRRPGAAPTPEDRAQWTWLAVPPKERETVKTAGAKWDAEQELWYAPPDKLEALKAWVKPVVMEPVWLAVREEEYEAVTTAGARYDNDRKMFYAPRGAAEDDFKTWMVPAFEEDTFLSVLPRDRNAARDAGAKWNSNAKLWFAPAGVPRDDLEQWVKPCILMSPLPLGVRRSEREAVKVAGGVWDRDLNQWIAPRGAVAQDFARWVRPTLDETEHVGIPVAERDAAKEAGAYWDKDAGLWCLPKGAVLEDVQPWRDSAYVETPIPLAVTRDDTEAVKAAGAHWDKEQKQWVAPRGADPQDFARWMKPLIQERTPLFVAYEDREAAKVAGARWDKDKREWYAPRGAAKDALDRWTEPEQKKDQGHGVGL